MLPETSQSQRQQPGARLSMQSDRRDSLCLVLTVSDVSAELEPRILKHAESTTIRLRTRNAHLPRESRMELQVRQLQSQNMATRLRGHPSLTALSLGSHPLAGFVGVHQLGIVLRLAPTQPHDARSPPMIHNALHMGTFRFLQQSQEHVWILTSASRQHLCQRCNKELPSLWQSLLNFNQGRKSRP